jgi:hypothetical protein
MAMLSTIKRLARLGGWVALSAGAMVAAALTTSCGTSHVVGTPKDAGADAPRDAAQGFVFPDAKTEPDAGTGEAGDPVDADKTDLWNVICE